MILAQTLEQVLVVDENGRSPETALELAVVYRLSRIAKVGFELRPTLGIEAEKMVVVGHDLQDKKDVEIIQQLLPLCFGSAPSIAGGVEAPKNTKYSLVVQIEQTAAREASSDGKFHASSFLFEQSC
jgi:hypothetical protein